MLDASIKINDYKVPMDQLYILKRFTMTKPLNRACQFELQNKQNKLSLYQRAIFNNNDMRKTKKFLCVRIWTITMLVLVSWNQIVIHLIISNLIDFDLFQVFHVNRESLNKWRRRKSRYNLLFRYKSRYKNIILMPIATSKGLHYNADFKYLSFIK